MSWSEIDKNDGYDNNSESCIIKDATIQVTFEGDWTEDDIINFIEEDCNLTRADYLKIKNLDDETLAKLFKYEHNFLFSINDENENLYKLFDKFKDIEDEINAAIDTLSSIEYITEDSFAVNLEKFFRDMYNTDYFDINSATVVDIDHKNHKYVIDFNIDYKTEIYPDGYIDEITYDLPDLKTTALNGINKILQNTIYKFLAATNIKYHKGTVRI